MRSAGFNLLLALVWALFLGEVSLRSLALGFLIGFVILALFRRALGATPYVRSVLGALALTGYFLWELVRANLHMALLALRAHPRLNPLIVGVPLRLEGDVPLTLLASLTGLLPGTVALGFSPDRRVLYVHALGMDDARAARASVLAVERRLLRLTGGSGAEEATPRPPRR
ncbi:Na+/H+ antiporter subunit E [Deinococcus budaensis]|uniref:Multicomponent Na+:H+ antiporter subunit E n=1 Tax=Deinococcus budaensis TaxID=1665626 RepID=A0A7W8GIZ6_9DEIO|nr:Na+/H+ antiporter subunit E [Deinococcus budaensis]MBB5236108.1 multicomponent Na+:H+ antiporter subunit E [Deinococcus budaensis]